MPPDIPTFIARWRDFGGEERANKDSFFIELCQVLGVTPPSPKTGDPEKDRYVFEADVRVPHEGQTTTVQKVDVYKHGCFLIEAKQGRVELSKKLSSAKRGTPAWAEAMNGAKGQALGYARMMAEPPPFLIVADLGYCFDLYASFDGTDHYQPFPNPQGSRLFVADLAAHVDLLRAVFTDPGSLDPSKRAAKVTREVAEHLARLAQELERAEHPPELVAKFLMRCLFTMFAEDVGLLPADPKSGKGLFTAAIEQHWIPSPPAFPGGIEGLWRAMNAGTHFGFMGKLLRFNGGLFAEPHALPLGDKELRLLHEAASCNWADVEPAIFGTLLERALSPKERHALGAHYTPRAYVERLVRPTIEEPLRADWDLVQAEVRQLVEADKLAQAKKAVRAFHQKLCETRVLDPACGSGNFLYVALDVFQRLEAEVLGKLEGLGETQQLLAADTLRVTPAQFLGIEVKPWAKEIAELVLWIGYLQHHVRAHGKASPPPEPVLQDYKNIQCRDAVLEWDSVELERDAKGKPVTRWDGETMKKSPVTGKLIPDEGAQVPVERYINPRRAKWPRADYVVGNPPFVGNKRMRATLGDGYVEALRKAYPELSDSIDFVMYWWNKAARRVATGKVRRMGLITTNSITQTFNRAVVTGALEGDPPVSLVFAIPDHPWVDSGDGAQVRIAMTVVVPGGSPGLLARVVSELPNPSGEPELLIEQRDGLLTPALSVGINTTGLARLQANRGLACPGMQLSGQGFLVSLSDMKFFTIMTRRDMIRPYITGRDLAQRMREQYVIDTAMLSQDELQEQYPDAFQWLTERECAHSEKRSAVTPKIQLSMQIIGGDLRSLGRNFAKRFTDSRM